LGRQPQTAYLPEQPEGDVPTLAVFLPVFIRQLLDPPRGCVQGRLLGIRDTLHLQPEGGQRRHRQDGDGRGGVPQRPPRVAATPAPEPLEPPPRPGLDRFACLIVRQVVRQRRGAGVTPGRLFVQAGEDDRLQVAIHGRVQPPRRERLVFAHLPQRLRDV